MALWQHDSNPDVIILRYHYDHFASHYHHAVIGWPLGWQWEGKSVSQTARRCACENAGRWLQNGTAGRQDAGRHPAAVPENYLTATLLLHGVSEMLGGYTWEQFLMLAPWMVQLSTTSRSTVRWVAGGASWQRMCASDDGRSGVRSSARHEATRTQLVHVWP